MGLSITILLIVIFAFPSCAFSNSQFTGGVGLFLPVSAAASGSSPEDILRHVSQKALEARSANLQFVNLIVDWRDLQPNTSFRRNTDALAWLSSLIK